MRRAAILVAAAVLAGCGGGDDRRAETAKYIEAANRLQEEIAPARQEAQAAVQAFARGRSGPRLAERLQAASSTIKELRASLSLLQPPEEARSLHGHLLELLELQAQVTLELSLAADYLPQAIAAIRPADAARGELRRALARATTRDAQAAALAAYARRVDVELGRLERLGTPPVLRPWHAAQETRLAASRDLAGELAAAVRRGDAAAIDRARRAFVEQSPDPRRAQQEQEAAVALFNERLELQEELLQTIFREQAELVDRFAG